jgi:hypothetical protein
MKISVEKPGSPEDILEHFGAKGMKWGVRKEQATSGSGPTVKKGMSTKKKVAIGVGVGVAVAGSAFVAHKLKQSGHLPVSPLSNRHPMEVKKLLQEHGDVKLSSREWKRYSRMVAADRARAVRMNSAQIQAALNVARSKMPLDYVRDSMGNYVPIGFKRR